MLEIMNLPGFLGTRAPLFMDIVSLIVAFLPFLMLGIIALAKQKKYKLHTLLQGILYAISVLVITFFEIGVRLVGGFKSFMEGSSVGHDDAFIVLIFHIMISVITLIIWTTTLLTAKKQLQLKKHKRAGWMTFIGVTLTTLTGGWVYFILFVY
jgi:putative membrane protein